MPVLPAGYANSSTPLYETNEDPDPVQNIVGQSGINVARVGDNVTLSPIAPFSITAPAGAQINLINQATPSTTYSIFNSSTTASGLVAGNLQIYGYGTAGSRQILSAASDSSFITLGGEVVGGTVVQVSGTAGSSRVNDPLYNPANALIPLVIGGSGNISYNSTTTLTPGKYMIQVSGEAVTPAVGTRLRIYASGPGSSTSVINYSNNSIGYDALLTEFSMNSNIFTLTAPGVYRVFVISTGTNWTASDWNLQLVAIQ